MTELQATELLEIMTSVQGGVRILVFMAAVFLGSCSVLYIVRRR